MQEIPMRNDTGYIHEDPTLWTRTNVFELEQWVERNTPTNVRHALLGLLTTVDPTAPSKFKVILGLVADEVSAIEVAIERIAEQLPPMLAWEAEDIRLRRIAPKTKAVTLAIAKHKEKRPTADNPEDLSRLARQELPYVLGGARLALAALNQILNENEGAL